MGIGSQVGMDIDGEDRFDRSGCSVTMSSDGTSVIVGGHHNGGVDGCSSGHARVFSSISSSPPPSLLSSSSSSRISSSQKGFSFYSRSSCIPPYTVDLLKTIF